MFPAHEKFVIDVFYVFFSDSITSWCHIVLHVSVCPYPSNCSLRDPIVNYAKISHGNDYLVSHNAHKLPCFPPQNSMNLHHASCQHHPTHHHEEGLPPMRMSYRLMNKWKKKQVVVE